MRNLSAEQALRFGRNKGCCNDVIRLKTSDPGRRLPKMAFTKEQAIERARRDLAARLSVNEDEIKEVSVEEAEFPDMALGAPVKDEMSGQMMTSGWRIRLTADGKSFEYRANSNQLRLVNHKGTNYKI